MSIVILGGGIAGMLAAYVLRKFKPTVIEAATKVGGNFMAGGLKYIHDTPQVRELLAELGMTAMSYWPRGLVLVDGIRYSIQDLDSVSSNRRRSIQMAHWEKTRGTRDGFREDCMNDPSGDHQALHCDHAQLFERLESAVRLAGCEIRLGSVVLGISDPDGWKHGSCAVLVRDGEADAMINYQTLIPTLPLGVLKRLAPWAGFPDAQANKLCVAKFLVPSHKRHRGWDYMYTPNEEWISRVSWPEKEHISVEIPWHLATAKFNQHIMDPTSIIGHITVHASRVCELELEPIDVKLIPGHLRPLSEEPIWPKRWHALGRFAEWNPRATADKVLARALTIKATLDGSQTDLG